jgi:putative transposase
MTYHLVWCPELEGEAVALEIRPDHVHLFAKFPPTLAVCQIVHHLKGYTAYSLRREFPRLKQHLPSLWTRSYYVGTAGEVSAATIRRYIEAQGGCREQRE